MRKKKVDQNQISFFEMESFQPPEVVITSKVPDSFVQTQDNVSNALTTDLMDESERILELEKKKGRKKSSYITKITITYEGVDIQNRYGFSAFDQEVHDSVVSLYLAGNEYITPAMVYRAMTGKTESEYVHDDRVQEIERSIDKCRFSQLKIDAVEEAKAFGYDQATYSGNMLNADKVEIKTGGHRVTGYKLLAEPLLYRYTKASNQISVVDIKLLATPITKTIDIIVLQGFLLRKIEAMKNVNSERILYFSDIYEHLEAENATRQKKEKIRKFCKEILEFWIQKNYIKQYCFNNKGRVIHSITVFI